MKEFIFVSADKSYERHTGKVIVAHDDHIIFDTIGPIFSFHLEDGSIVSGFPHEVLLVGDNDD